MNLRELVIRLMKGEEIELERVEARREGEEKYRKEEPAHEPEKAEASIRTETREVETQPNTEPELRHGEHKPENNVQTRLHEPPHIIVDTSLVEKYITETRKLLENTRHITTTDIEELEKIEKTLTELARQVAKQAKQLANLLTEVNTELIKIVQLRQVLAIGEKKHQEKTRH